MPIRQIEQGYEFGAGLPCIGRLRKGGKKQTNRPGADLNYFRFTPEPGYERYASIFPALYGAEPTFFSPVRFGGSVVEDVFDFWMKEHTATKLTRKCDGETQVRWFDARSGETSNEPVACAAPDCACKQVGRLKLFLPDLINEIGVFGYVLLSTTSLWDIRNILSCLRDLERIVGDLSSVDFLIGRAPRFITVPVPEPKDKSSYRRNHEGRDWKPGDRMNTTKNLIYIRPNESYTKRVLLGAVTTDSPQLPAGEAERPQLMQKPRPPRRIGAKANEPPPVEDDDEDERDESPAWLDEGLKWVRDSFEGMNSQHVNQALEAVEGWQASKETFMAAIICFRFGYALPLIEEYTSARNLLKVWDIARDICAGVEQAEGEVVNG